MSGGRRDLRLVRPGDGPTEDLSALRSLQLPPLEGAGTAPKRTEKACCRCCKAREDVGQVVVTFYRQGAEHNVAVNLCGDCDAANCQPMDDECRKPLPIACLDTMRGEPR